MTRVKRGFISRKYHKKVIKLNKGFRGAHSRLFKVANEENMKAFRYSYFDRRKKKRSFKNKWIKQINLSARIKKIKYNQFINKLKKNKISINKKILAKIAIKDNKTFNKITNY